MAGRPAGDDAVLSSWARAWLRGHEVHDALDRLWTALDAYLYGFTLQEARAQLCFDVQASVERHQGLLADGTYPELQAMAAWVMGDDHPGPATFEYGLGVLLATLHPDPSPVHDLP